jgi:hypothetical protein
MSQRSKEIIRTIKKAGSKAGDRTLDLNRKEVENLRQNTKKTYKEFLEGVIKPGDSHDFERKFHPKEKNSHKELKGQEIEANNRRAREDSSSSGQGILGYYKDPETGKVRKGRKKEGKIAWAD